MGTDGRIIHIVDSSDFVVRQNSLHKTPRWWACPVRLSRRGEQLVGAHPNGLAHYGVWCLLVGFMATCRYRWTLTDSDGRPVLLGDLAWKWRVSLSYLEEAVNRLVEIGWLAYQEPSSLPAMPPATHETDETRRDGTNGTVRNERDGAASRPPVSQWESCAVRLGLSRPSVESFALLEERGVPAGVIEMALREGEQCRGEIKSVEKWAGGVRRNLAAEHLG